jgi:hypothetical protein
LTHQGTALVAQEPLESGFRVITHTPSFFVKIMQLFQAAAEAFFVTFFFRMLLVLVRTEGVGLRRRFSFSFFGSAVGSSRQLWRSP